ncbi:peptidylprolyl isomerase [Aestuariivivens sediminicola]|uniref:peptidylprolyl isomerase n=1 Tax=Aestuariivivens sediminicola TaxID=2913560 RepID=UPI001F57ED98|nr:peptidylprolyl isomerase [Aestuariivivens sediminicola]
MKSKYFSIVLFFFFVINYNAQSNEDAILFSIDGAPVYVSEFLRVYNKNLELVQDESQKDVDEYLKLFTNYKLKLKEARALGLDKRESYSRELNTYKKQLASSFISDSKVTDDLVEEAYARISNDVKANHILVRIDDSASPEDTLVAYNKILKLRERAIAEGFENIRKEVHNGKTVFGEALGYFNGFKMVYNFENAAFKTPVGEISMPFRTRFGYHIVKVFDKRKSRGERTVAHIMIGFNSKDTLHGSPETRINEIYQKINQGEEFEDLARQFSEDKSSSSKGGLLKPFSGGQLSAPEFEDVAFSLESAGEVSEPFKTKFGWHIIKLYEKTPVPPFEVMKPELEVKVKRDDRSRLIDEALYKNLRTRYKISDDQPALDYFVSILNENYFRRTWTLPEDFSADSALIKIGNRQLRFNDFGDYLLKSQRTVQKREPFNVLVRKHYNDFLNASLMRYREDNLEFENEDFAHILREYQDGLLLFDLMESKIWDSSKDSIQIQNFYASNKSKYYVPERIQAIVASSTTQKPLKKVAKLLEQGLALDRIKNLINGNDSIEVIFTSGIMDSQHQALPKDYTFKMGLSKIYKHNSNFVLVQVKEIVPETLKSFEEAKGAIISDYQEFKEAQWIKELHEKYKVVVDKQVLNQVKKMVNRS